MREFISIDFETGNPKRVSACAIGYAKVSDGEVIESNGHLIKPVGGHASFQSKIHGIKEEHTINQPDFGKLFPELQHIFSYPLVAHSLFDKQVLNALSDHFDLDLNFEYIDSCEIAKEKLPELKNHKLKTLVKYFQFPKFKHHDAKEDAIACANIFLKLQGLSGDSTTISDDMHEFKGMINGILADDEVNYREAYELVYWLDDHPAVAGQNQKLYSKVMTALEDNDLDSFEAKETKLLLAETLNKLSIAGV